MDKPKDKVTKPEGCSSHGCGSTGPQNLILNTNKAGMEGLDTEKINEIIKNASEGSRFYQHKQKCQQRLDIKISQMKQAAAAFTEDQIKKATFQMDDLVNELEVNRDLSQTIVHVDMDMFYAAVEMRDDPSLRNKPMAVGGMGMLSTSNYAARKFGVRAAMPGFIGKKLCPDLVIVPPNFTKYKQVSKEVQEVFAEYDANFSPMSLDEAYLNITEYMRKNAHRYDLDTSEDFEDGTLCEAIVAEMRQKINDKTHLTASAGIAPNTRLAKVCSDINKPDGQYYLPPDREKILKFISSLPIRKVTGIGNVMEQQLHALDITVCSHLMEKRGLLKLLFSDISYNSFMNVALGLGHTSLGSWTEKDRKSISTETTFRDTADKVTLFRLTEDLCKELVDDMEQKDILGKVFTLKLKTSDFQIKTRAQTLSDATRALDVMISTAKRLLQHEMDASIQPLSLRLLGVRMSNLVSSSEVGPVRQITLTQMFSRSSKPKTDLVASGLVEKTLIDPSSSHTSENQLNLKNIHEPSIIETNNTIVASSVQNADIITSDPNKTENPFKKKLLSEPEESLHTLKTENHECPVCRNQVNVSDMKDFLVHVDRCCESTASKQYSPTKPNDAKRNNDGAMQPIRMLTSLKDVKNVVDVEIVAEVSDSIHFGPKVCSNEDSAYNYCDYDDESSEFSEVLENTTVREITEHADTQISRNPKLEFVCPVCEQKQFKTLSSLNEHVDECLSDNVISEILQQDTTQLEPSSSTQISSRLSKSVSHNCTMPQVASKRKGNLSNRGKKKLRLGSNTLDKYFCS